MTAANSPVNWVIAFGELEVDEARLYKTLPNDQFVLKRAGRVSPASARDIISRWPAFEVALDPGKPTRLYLRLSGVTSPFVSARILPLKQFISNEGVDLLILAGVLGFITAMLVYNLVVYVRSRLHQCLYYFLYLAFIIIHVVIYDGLIYRFSDFTLSGHVADILSQSSGVAAGLSLLLFGRALLRLPQTAPRLSKLTLWFSAVTIFILFLEIIRVLPYATISSVVLILSGFFMSGCAVYFALRGVKPALYFSFSFLALLLGVAIDMYGFHYPVALGPEPTIWENLVGVQQNWSFHLGICAEAVLISFAITYFIKDMRSDIETARSTASQARAATEELKDEYEGKLAAVAEKARIRERITEKVAGMVSSKSGDEVFLEQAAAAIAANMGEKDFDVARLASELAVSEQTLCRRIHRAAGVTPVEFLRQQRLTHAKQLLETRAHNTVAEVANAVGIFNAGRFAKLYRETFGQSPSEVLKRG